MDIRHPLTSFDRLMIEWCRHWDLPLHIALTKADKLGRSAALQALRTVEAELKTIEGLEISLQIFSALKRVGLEEAWAVLDRWLGLPGASGPE
jgi:GTP-binding protein